jgi:TPR repeat
MRRIVVPGLVAAIVALWGFADPVMGASQQDYDDCSQTADVARSIAACTRVIADQAQSATDRANAYLQRGNAYVVANRLDDAIADYSAAIQLSQNSVLEYAARAIAYWRKGDRERAVSDYRQAGQIDAAELAEMVGANGELKELGALAATQGSPAPRQSAAGSDSPAAPSPSPVSPSAPPSIAEPVRVTIRARNGWQSSGVAVHGTGTVEFRAAGRWVFNPGLPAVDGDGDCRFSTQGRTMYAYSGPNGCEGQLIGRIGEGRPFVVGAGGSHPVAGDENGQIYLVINDDLEGAAGKGLTDNRGSLAVTIRQR